MYTALENILVVLKAVKLHKTVAFGYLQALRHGQINITIALAQLCTQ